MTSTFFDTLRTVAADAGVEWEPGGERAPIEGPEFETHATYSAKDRGKWDGLYRHDLPLCDGTLRFTSMDGPIWTVDCDAGCGLNFGIPRAQVDQQYVVGQRLDRSNLPLHYLANPFEETAGTAAARDALRSFINGWELGDDRPRGPMMIGEPGLGKTHLLTITGNVLVGRHALDAYYCTMLELLDDLKRGMDQPSYRPVVYERARTCELLVFDDLGAERPTEWAVDRLAALIDDRYRAGKPMIGATNIVADEWPEAFGHRTASRIAGLTRSVTVEGTDFRV